MQSSIPGFYEMSLDERLELVKKFAGLEDDEIKALKKDGALENDIAQIMIENVIGTAHLPLGVATYFLINGKDYLIPMAIEEPSVVAAASHAAKLARTTGGFKTSSTEPIMIGQIQMKNVPDIDAAEKKIMENVDAIKAIAHKQDSTLIKKGGGLASVECRKLDTERGKMLVVHLNIDVRDAMGANAVNTMCESLAPKLEELTDELIQKTLEPCRLALKDAGLETKDIQDEEVCSTGITPDPARCTHELEAGIILSRQNF